MYLRNIENRFDVNFVYDGLIKPNQLENTLNLYLSSIFIPTIRSPFGFCSYKIDYVDRKHFESTTYKIISNDKLKKQILIKYNEELIIKATNYKKNVSYNIYIQNEQIFGRKEFILSKQKTIETNSFSNKCTNLFLENFELNDFVVITFKNINEMFKDEIIPYTK